MSKFIDKTLKLYNKFHSWGTQFIAIQAHIGMGFFFPTVFSIFGFKVMIAVSILMLTVIAIKEYLDDKTSKKAYSLIDLSSWFVGDLMSIIVELIKINN